MRTRVTLQIWGKRLAAAAALAAGLAGVGCSPDASSANKANVFLIVTEVKTKPGGGGEEGAFLLSDVIRVKDPTGFFNDNATITLRNTGKNPLLGTSSHYNDVALERYAVRYFRSDGRNAEGVDVPYAFQGPLAGTVATEGETEVALILVRHQAKEEPPLSRLEGSGGADIITCFAEVIMYGKTLSGEVVSARATINVTFADFGD
jgi:hypothetical protein